VPTPPIPGAAWVTAYRRFRDDLIASNEYSQAAAALAADPVIGPQLGALVGTSAQVERVDADRILGGFLWTTIALEPGLEGGRAAFDAAYERVHNELVAEEIESVMVAPLRSVEVPAPPVSLDDLEIDRMTNEEVAAGLDTAVLPSFPPGRPITLPQTEVAVRLRYRLPKVVVRQPGEPPSTWPYEHEAPVSRVNRVVDALRLVSPSPVGVYGFMQSSAESAIGGRTQSWMPHLFPPVRAGTVLSLEGDAVDKLLKFYRALSAANVRDNKAVAGALRRFGYSYARGRDDDRTVDLMTRPRPCSWPKRGRRGTRENSSIG